MLLSMILALISRIIYLITKVFDLTYRYRFSGIQNIKDVQSSGHQAYVLGIWHQNLLPGILAQKTNKYACIVSRSKDANPVVFTLLKMNHFVRRGSSRKDHRDKGGRQAKEQIIDILKLGIPSAITIDGPKGPCHEVKPGIIDIAKKSGRPIVPYTVIANNYWSFNSWDKFRLPKPFSKIIVHYGKPIFVPSDAEGDDFIQVAKELKNSLFSDEKIVFENLERWSEFTPENPPLDQPKFHIEPVV